MTKGLEMGGNLCSVHFENLEHAIGCFPVTFIMISLFGRFIIYLISIFVLFCFLLKNDKLAAKSGHNHDSFGNEFVI